MATGGRTPCCGCHKNSVCRGCSYVKNSSVCVSCVPKIWGSASHRATRPQQPHAAFSSLNTAASHGIYPVSSASSSQQSVASDADLPVQDPASHCLCFFSVVFDI